MPIAGDTQNGEIAFDLGANAGLLFGRQRAHVRHHETAVYVSTTAACNNKGYHAAYPPRTFETARSHSVTVPNIGGFAGVSFRKRNAKISSGYRADEFFGAVDGGIDAYKSETRGFYGPFATMSIGLGG